MLLRTSAVSIVKVMEPLGFESVRYITPEEFCEFVEERERAGDLNRYELLNGRVVLNPPEGWPHGAVGRDERGARGGWDG